MHEFNGCNRTDPAKSRVIRAPARDVRRELGSDVPTSACPSRVFPTRVDRRCVDRTDRGPAWAGRQHRVGPARTRGIRAELDRSVIPAGRSPSGHLHRPPAGSLITRRPRTATTAARGRTVVPEDPMRAATLRAGIVLVVLALIWALPIPSTYVGGIGNYQVTSWGVYGWRYSYHLESGFGIAGVDSHTTFNYLPGLILTGVAFVLVGVFGGRWVSGRRAAGRLVFLIPATLLVVSIWWPDVGGVSGGAGGGVRVFPRVVRLPDGTPRCFRTPRVPTTTRAGQGVADPEPEWGTRDGGREPLRVDGGLGAGGPAVRRRRVDRAHQDEGRGGFTLPAHMISVTPAGSLPVQHEVAEPAVQRVVGLDDVHDDADVVAVLAHQQLGRRRGLPQKRRYCSSSGGERGPVLRELVCACTVRGTDPTCGICEPSS